jgi:integrase
VSALLFMINSRHTFATELLTDGRSLETVAALLGHGSTKITERYYSHWVKQEKLEDELKKSWAHLGTVANPSGQKSSKSR